MFQNPPFSLLVVDTEEFNVEPFLLNIEITISNNNTIPETIRRTGPKPTVNVIIFVTKSFKSTTWPTIETIPIETKIATIAIITGMKAEVTDPNTNANIINATDIPMVSPVTRSFSASSAKVCSIVAVPIKKNSNSLLEKSSVK